MTLLDLEPRRHCTAATADRAVKVASPGGRGGSENTMWIFRNYKTRPPEDQEPVEKNSGEGGGDSTLNAPMTG